MEKSPQQGGDLPGHHRKTGEHGPARPSEKYALKKKGRTSRETREKPRGRVVLQKLASWGEEFVQ